MPLLVRVSRPCFFPSQPTSASSRLSWASASLSASGARTSGAATGEAWAAPRTTSGNCPRACAAARLPSGLAARRPGTEWGAATSRCRPP
eukprot:7498441-Pyramimonas_sp.AAC.1